jgi:hypothetical protein
MGTPRDIDEIVADEEGLITVDGLDRLPRMGNRRFTRLTNAFSTGEGARPGIAQREA